MEIRHALQYLMSSGDLVRNWLMPNVSCFMLHQALHDVDQRADRTALSWSKRPSTYCVVSHIPRSTSLGDRTYCRFFGCMYPAACVLHTLLGALVSGTWYGYRSPGVSLRLVAKMLALMHYSSWYPRVSRTFGTTLIGALIPKLAGDWLIWYWYEGYECVMNTGTHILQMLFLIDEENNVSKHYHNTTTGR